MKSQLGAPTQYDFSLPVIRRDLCKGFYSKITNHVMLDYGCGNGANTVLFARDFDLVIGVDVERGRLCRAREIAEERNIYNVRYLLYEGNYLPILDSSVNLAISFEVLEHTDNDYQSLKEIRRVLKKKGLFCLSVPNKWYVMETHGFNLPFKEFIPYNRMPFLNWLPSVFYKRYGNARIYTKKDIVSLLKQAGFTILYCSYITPPFDKVRHPIIRRCYKKLYSFLPDFMGVSLFVVCEK